ncbi:MAG: HAD-IA family hydrolase [Thiohalomonadaceae bacterium]
MSVVRPSNKKLKTILFDLDGTLADTAPDLAYALNQTLQEAGRTPLPYELIRPVASHGAAALLQLGFGTDMAEQELSKLRNFLLDVYLQNITRESVLFAGISELLAAIEQQGLNWGVVTNKPAYLTMPLMRELGLAERAITIISGDTLPQCKPHPAPMWQACKEAGSEVDECLYLGDAERDIIAGREAGITTVVALYGYIDKHEQPHKWGADMHINKPTDLLQCLD